MYTYVTPLWAPRAHPLPQSPPGSLASAHTPPATPTHHPPPLQALVCPPPHIPDSDPPPYAPADADHTRSAARRLSHRGRGVRGVELDDAAGGRGRGSPGVSISGGARPPRPTTALVSFPGSGNTWIRYLLQQVTGYYSGSVYKDYALMKNGFPAESVSNGSVVVVKTHEWGPEAAEEDPQTHNISSKFDEKENDIFNAISSILRYRSCSPLAILPPHPSLPPPFFVALSLICSLLFHLSCLGLTHFICCSCFPTLSLPLFLVPIFFSLSVFLFSFLSVLFARVFFFDLFSFYLSLSSFLSFSPPSFISHFPPSSLSLLPSFSPLYSLSLPPSSFPPSIFRPIKALSSALPPTHSKLHPASSFTLSFPFLFPYHLPSPSFLNPPSPPLFLPLDSCIRIPLLFPSPFPHSLPNFHFCSFSPFLLPSPLLILPLFFYSLFLFPLTLLPPSSLPSPSTFQSPLPFPLPHSSSFTLSSSALPPSSPSPFLRLPASPFLLLSPFPTLPPLPFPLVFFRSLPPIHSLLPSLPGLRSADHFLITKQINPGFMIRLLHER
ncbi:hypothetical protein C7M84_006707 [Penaeus vannamei]|uniref:Uncharacterized protein n=1 Tax=Penaeus vannamei TaxID=6689 RepID=A0A423TE64_PENVA|nr:hypothetical protein C7M84_006707 [Penaeus vannamei]